MNHSPVQPQENVNFQVKHSYFIALTIRPINVIKYKTKVVDSILNQVFVFSDMATATTIETVTIRRPLKVSNLFLISQ